MYKTLLVTKPIHANLWRREDNPLAGKVVRAYITSLDVQLPGG